MYKDRVFWQKLSIIGSFAVWEAANVWIVDKPAMQLQQRRLKKMMETEVRCTVLDTTEG